MTIAAATYELSVGAILDLFAARCLTAARDATAIYRVLYGIDDGNNYGRYFGANDPLLGFLESATSVADMIAQGTVQRAQVAAAIAVAQAAVSNPATFPAAALTLTGTLRRACANPGDAVRLLSGLSEFAESVDGGPDALGRQIAILAVATAMLLRRAAAISLAIASADYAPTSQTDAQTVRDLVGDRLDEIAVEAGDVFDDASRRALDAARVAVIEDLTTRGGNLAVVAERKFNARLPAVVLAYRLYQDSNRAGDLLARNDCPHPSFMPTVIEALAR